MLKRRSAVILSAAMLLSTIGSAFNFTTVSANDGGLLGGAFAPLGDAKVVNLKDASGSKSGVVTYQFGLKDFSETTFNGKMAYNYNDAYFAASSDVYNKDLSTLSLSLAAVAYGAYSKDAKADDANVKDFFKEIGFDGYSANKGFTDTAAENVGVAVASKKLTINNETTNVVAVALRGTEYVNDVLTDLNIGSTGNHAGFEAASNDAVAFINNYIKENNLGNAKIWISGFGKSAAVSNIAAAALSKEYSNANVYAYNFGAPAVTTNSDTADYTNIFNIIDANDPVTKIGFSKLGFKRYGVDKYLSTEVSDKDYKAVSEKAGEFKAMQVEDDIINRMHDALAVRDFTGIENLKNDNADIIDSAKQAYKNANGKKRES